MKKKKLVSIVMGSQSDWKTLINCENIFKDLGIGLKKKLFLLIEHLIDYMNLQQI